MKNRVVHFEIPCDDPQKTIRFFESVFGWKIQRYGEEDYWFVITGEEGTPGINGGIMKKRDSGQPVVNSIEVENIDEMLKAIEKAGGTVVVPKVDVGGMGWSAYFKDPDGNIHGVWQTVQQTVPKG